MHLADSSSFRGRLEVMGAADLEILLAYERLRFDRAFNHIVAIADRVNILSAAASIIVVAFLSVCFDYEIMGSIGGSPAFMSLFLVGTISAICAVLVCIRFLFKRFTLKERCGKSMSLERKEFLVETDDPARMILLMREYAELSEPYIKREHKWLEAAAVLLIISLVLLAILIAVAVTAHPNHQPSQYI